MSFDTPDLSSLKRQLQARSMEREAAEQFFSRERASTEEAQRHLQESLNAASQSVSVRRRRVQEAERALLRDGANFNRQLNYKEERIARLEATCSEQRRAAHSVNAELESVQAKLLEARQALSVSQQKADNTLQRIRAEEEKINDLRRATMAAHASRVSDSELQRQDREALERHLRELEASSAAVLESTRQLSATMSEAEAAHSTKMGAAKRQLTELHNQYESTRSELTGIRRSLTILQDDEEDAARRRRKAEEESQREYLTERKAEVAKAASSREEKLRLVRSEYDKAASSLHAQIDEANAALQPLREESNTLFDTELRLSEEVTRLKDQLLGIDELRERRAAGEQTLQRLKTVLAELDSSIESLVVTKKGVEDEHRMMRDILAPAQDVANAIAKLHDRHHADRQSLADLEAHRVVQRVAVEARVEGLAAEIHRLHSVVASIDERKGDAAVEVSERRRVLESDMRVLQAESEAVAVKLQDMQNRNKLLDSTIEHSARQKKLLLEDLENRRELARRAAASLLAQLEE